MLVLRSRRAVVASAPTIIAALGVLAVGGVAAWAAPAVTRIAVNSIGAGQIKSNAVISSKIAPKAVTKSDIASNAVVGATVVDGSLSAADLGSASVGSDELAAGSVTVASLAAGSVTAASIAPSSVASVQLADGGVASADIANAAITNAKIADGSISSSKLAAESVTADKIAPGVIGVLSLTNGQVTTAKLDDDSVTSAKIVDGTITTDDLDTGSVDTDEIATNAVASDEIASNAVQGSEIAAGAVTNGKLAAGAVDSTSILNAGIATADYADGSVTAAKIAPGVDGQVLATESGAVVWADPNMPGRRTIYVEADPSNAPQNGSNLVAANAYVAANAALDEWEIVLEPGIYTLPAPLTLDERTNLRGAGATLTTINGSLTSAGGTALLTTPTDDSGVRIGGLTIMPTGNSASGIVGLHVSTPSLTPQTTTLRDVAIVMVDNTLGSTTNMRWAAGARVDAQDLDLRATDTTAATGVLVTNDAAATVDGLTSTIAGGGTDYAFDLTGATAAASVSVRDADVDAGSGSVVHVTSTHANSVVEFAGSTLSGDLGADTAALMRRIRDSVVGGVIDSTDPTKITCSGVDEIPVDQYVPLDADCA